ncbi:MAG: histidine phosphatase family protein [Eubacteriales bacterium]|nr:histidine phosphatase family protein [Eubacteriales bacterium]
MRLYIIRHGETDWNRRRLLQGHSDVPLNENGIRLAEVTGEALCGIPFDLCIAGPLTRTRQTAVCVLKHNRAFLEKWGKPGEPDITDFKPLTAEMETRLPDGFPLLTDERIIEANFGTWEGFGCGPCNMEIPVENFRDFFKNPALVKMPEGAETTEDVKRRTAGFLRALSEAPAFRDKTILVATHGFAVRAMLNPFYEDPSDFWQGRAPYNCAINLLETDAKGKLCLTVRDKIYYDEKLAATYTDKKG